MLGCLCGAEEEEEKEEEEAGLGAELVVAAPVDDPPLFDDVEEGEPAATLFEAPAGGCDIAPTEDAAGVPAAA